MFRGLQVIVSGVVLAGFALVGPSVVLAQDAAAKPAPVMVLDGEAAVIILLIKPEGTANFESVLAKYREALEKNDNATRKTQLAGMKFFKSPTAMAGSTAFIIYVDPVVKGEEYDITRVVTEVFPVEVKEIYEKYKAAYAGRQIIPLNKVQ